MSIKEFTTDEALLSTPCEKATAEDAAVAQDLLDTLASLEGAACVHANQIGVTKSLFAYLDENDNPHVMYNPTILIGLVPKKETESCFTHEEPTVNTRYEKGKVSYQEAGFPQEGLPWMGSPAYPAHGRSQQGQTRLTR